MKNSKLVLMTIFGFSAALVASEEVTVVNQELVETSVVSQEEAVVTTEESVVAEESVVTETSSESTEAVEAVVATEDSVVAEESVVTETPSESTEDSVESTTPSYLEIAKASYNDFVAFSSEKIALASDYAQENPVIAASVATTAVVTIAGVTYYAYNCGKAKTKEVKNK